MRPIQEWWGLLAASALLSIAPALTHVAAQPGLAVERTRGDTKQEGIKHAENLSAAFEEVAETLRPSVVNISSVKRIKAAAGQRGMPGPFSDSPLREYFGDEFFRHFFRQDIPERGFVQQGLGTGVIVNKDGTILTNNHVVGGAEEVNVKLYDGRTLEATVVGADPKTDLAVIRVKAGGDLEPARLGNSDSLKVGEWVVAMGNPFGLDYTITAGIVSAKGRANMGIADYEDFIQTDAAINPGNSGGPLVNLRGEVVGINSAIATRSGYYMGVGFAIPISMARGVMESLVENGRVIRGWLGVAIQPLTEGLAESFGYQGREGALVGQVNPAGPADKAGLKSGDIIVEVDGRKIADVNQLRNLVAALEPGTTVDLRVFRDGSTRSIKVEIGEQEPEVAARAGESEDTTADLGMTVENITPELARRLGLDEAKGVVVTNVEQLSLAARAGLSEGDIILSIQGNAVENLSDFRREMARQDLSKGVRIVVRTGSAQRFVFLRSKPSE